jgi:hypothetical protein
MQYFSSQSSSPLSNKYYKGTLSPPWCYHQLPEWCNGDRQWCRMKMLNGVMSRSDRSSRSSQWADVRVPRNLGRLSDVGSGKRTKSFLSLLCQENCKSQRYRIEYWCRTAFRRVTTSHKQSDHLRWCPGTQPTYLYNSSRVWPRASVLTLRGGSPLLPRSSLAVDVISSTSFTKF